MKKAIVIGSTGMVGTQLIQLLLESNQYSEVISLVRRPSGVSHPKLTEHYVDFNDSYSWSHLVKGDVLFSTLGTTIANAKTKEAQYKVDYTFQYSAAVAATANNVANYVLISSAGANEKSSTFYVKMKGELDKAVLALPFKSINILRPGQLAGNRKEFRLGEIIGLGIMRVLNTIGILLKYKPIDAKQVAKAMINASNKNNSGIYTLDEVFTLAENK